MSKEVKISYNDKAFHVAEKYLREFKEKHKFFISFDVWEMEAINDLLNRVCARHLKTAISQKTMAIILFEFKIRAFSYSSYVNRLKEVKNNYDQKNKFLYELAHLCGPDVRFDELIILGMKKESFITNLKKKSIPFRISTRDAETIIKMVDAARSNTPDLDALIGLPEETTLAKSFGKKYTPAKLRGEFARIIRNYLASTLPSSSQADLFFIGGSLLFDAGLMPEQKIPAKSPVAFKTFIISNFKKALSTSYNNKKKL